MVLQDYVRVLLLSLVATETLNDYRMTWMTRREARVASPTATAAATAAATTTTAAEAITITAIDPINMTDTNKRV